MEMRVRLQAKRQLFQPNFNQILNESTKGCETLQYAIERTFSRDHSAVSIVQVDRRGVALFIGAPQKCKTPKKRKHTATLYQLILLAQRQRLCRTFVRR